MKWDYECMNCKRIYELQFKSVKERDETEKNYYCPKCKSPDKERQFPKTGSFQLKGKWYKQGY